MTGNPTSVYYLRIHRKKFKLKNIASVFCATGGALGGV
jgi:hypothetical protein